MTGIRRFIIATPLTLALIVAALAVGSITAGLYASGVGQEDKTTLCHIPADSPDNAHTIIVSTSGAAEHQDHGDAVGPCDTDGVTTEAGADGHQHGQRSHDEHPGQGNGHTKGHQPDGTGASANGDPEGDGADKVSVCHHGRTMSVAAAAVDDHLGHADLNGACP